MDFGVVLFHEDRIGPGWVSINGEPARTISGIGNLQSNVLWWTSLPFSEFHIAGLSRHPNIRSADYLRTSMSQIMQEIGINSRYADQQEAVQVLSEIFSRIMKMARGMYGLNEYTKDKLSEDIKTSVIYNDRSASDELDKACKGAYQAFTKCTVPDIKGARNMQFRLPRMTHSIDVLSTPTPNSKWEFISRKMLPKKNRLAWCVQQNRPVLAKIVVSEVSSDVANIVAFGSGSNNMRGWVSHPELIMLSRYAKIDVESVFLFEDYEPINLKVKPPISTGVTSLSVSAGLLAENFWVGLANPQSLKAGVKIHSPRSVWLRAADRSFCFIKALSCHNRGLNIKSYGVGSVMIGVPNGNLAEVINVAGEVGLLPPMTAPADAIIQEDLS